MSSKTLKDILAKTASVHSKFIFFAGITLLFGVVFANPASRQSVECLYYHTPINSSAMINGIELNLEVVESASAMEKGLSGRPCIKNGQAMLFKFDLSDQSNHCFWMKDMRFPIDIIWLDSSKKIIDVVNDIQPQTYPKNFCPNRPTAYVIEVKSNTSTKLGLSVGNIVSF